MTQRIAAYDFGIGLRQPGCPSALPARVKEALDARHLVFEADGVLIVIPVGSIKYLQCFPAPRKLPAYAIKGVSFNHES